MHNMLLVIHALMASPFFLFLLGLIIGAVIVVAFKKDA